MGKQERTEVKQQKGQGNRYKKQYNNYNPYNKLELNKYHQVNAKPNNYSQQIHKKKRDLERMIEYRKSKGLEVDEEKAQALTKIEQELGERRKDFEKDKRKQFFIAAEYKQIMNIQKRKVAKKIREIKEANPVDQQLLTEWYKKLNYIKNYPKTLKYVSLFPNTPLSDKAKQFQDKIINDIDADLAKKRQKLNSFEPEYKVSKVPKAKKDDFFLQDIEKEDNEDIEEQVDEEVEQEQEDDEDEE